MKLTEIVSKLTPIMSFATQGPDDGYAYHLLQDGNVKDFVEAFIGGVKAIKEKFGDHDDPQLEADEKFLSDLKGLAESLSTCIKQLENFSEVVDKWLTLRKESIDKLQGFIDELHSRKKDVNIARFSGASGGIVSGGLAILGILLAPVTAGGSLALTRAGIGLGVASGVTSIGATAAGAILDKGTVKDIKDVLAKDEMQSKKMWEEAGQTKEIKDKVDKYWDKISGRMGKLLSMLPNRYKIIASAAKDVSGKIFPAVKFAGSIVSNMDDVLKNVARSGTKVVGRVVGVGLIAIGIAVDAFDLILTSFDVHKGSRSKIADKMEKEVLQALKEEYDEIQSFRNNMTF